MRRQYFYWTYLVVALLCTIYGGYLLFYHLNHEKGFVIGFLLFFLAGIIMLIIYGILYFKDYKAKKNKVIDAPVVEEKKEEIKVEEKKEEVKKEEAPIKREAPKEREVKTSPRKSTSSYAKPSPSIRRGASTYIRQAGYGTVLRVDNYRFYDMREGRYYRLEGNILHEEGRGPMYEIRGNSIRDLYGSYLYEISGSNINKSFGGFFASISGGYITKYDSSEKYEYGDSLSTSEMLCVVVLLFGKY